MISFATLGAQLKLNITDFSSKLKDASKQAAKFGKDLKGSINGSTEAVDELAKATKKSGVEFKDVARIVQGIIISKVFYGALGSIRQATDAVWEFSSSLEYAKIAYSNLFDDTSLADEFINVLKDFAAKTPFSFKESEQASKSLLAYGVKYQNVMYMMQGIMAAAAMQGDPTKVESISRALGQIYTKGRLMNEEMRQLAEAGIPAYEILKEKLGLTQKQLQNLGNEAIPASKAINALVDGMTERFGNVVTASSRTMTGIISNIKDNATMLISAVFEPVYVKIKSVANAIGELLFKLREIQETLGTGGVFEYLVPEEARASIRLLLANILALHQAIVNLAIAIGHLLGPVAQSLMHVFNAIAPILASVLNILAGMINVITSNAAAMKVLTALLTAAAMMWVVFKLRALAAIVVQGVVWAITKSLAALGAVMTFVATHPLWALLIALTGIVAGLAIGFSGLGDKIRGFFSELTKINGYDPDKLLLPSQKDRANDLEKFNKKLDGTSDAMDDLADSTGKATKAAKGLLSFDEVFKLNEPDETSGKDAGIEIPDLDFSGLDLSGDAFIPEVPDFTGFSNNWFDALSDALKKKLLASGLGAVLGGILGGLLGGPIGAALGALVGGIAGFFWDDLATALGLTDVGKIALPIATGLGAALGWVAGGPAGMAIGAGIGLLVGWLVDSIARGIETGDWSSVGKPLGTALGAAIGFVVGGPGGAVIGAGIGLLIGGVIDLITKGFQSGDWDWTGIGGGIGLGIGGAIGMVMLGPGGAAIGAAIGGLVGLITGKIVEGFQTGNWDVSGISLGIGTGIGSAIGFVFGGPGGALIGAAIGALVGGITGRLIEEWNNAKDDIMAPWINLGAWISEAFGMIIDNIKQAFSSGNIVEIGSSIVLGIIQGILLALGSVGGAIIALFQTIWEAICAVFGIHSPAATMVPIGENIVYGIIQGITSMLSTLWSTLTATFASIVSGVSGTFSNIYNTISSSITTAASVVRNMSTDMYNNIRTNLSNALISAKTNMSSLYKSVRTSMSNALTSARTSASNILNSISSNFTKALNTAKSTFSNMYSSVSSSLSNLYNTASAKLSSVYNTFTSWASNLYTNVFAKLASWISSAVSGLNSLINLAGSAASAVSSAASSAVSWAKGKLQGHATGGVFNREHVARLNEGNKTEAVIPLEEPNAMQPFVDAVSSGLTASLAPLIASMSGAQQQTQQLQPLYVGTLIADERSLKELERKMNVIRIQEDKRR